MANELTDAGLLSRLRPPDERDLPTRRQLELREELIWRLWEDETPTWKAGGWSRRRLASVAAIAAALLAAGAAVAGYTLTQSGSEAPDAVTCHLELSLTSDFAYTASSGGRTPEQVCAGAWEHGDLGRVTGASPSWVACAGDGAGIDAFPGSDPGLCRGLGLRPLDAVGLRRSNEFSTFHDALAARLSANGCVTKDDALAATREAMATNGFGDWTAVATGFSGETPCAEPSFDSQRQIVTLVGQVRPELSAAVERVVNSERCGPRAAVVERIDQSLAQAGFSEWHAVVVRPLETASICVAGFNVEPRTTTVSVIGDSTG